MSGSSVPAVLDHLFALIQALPAVTTAGALVVDGGAPTSDPPVLVMVGATVTPTATAEGERTPSSLGNRQRRETYTVTNSITAMYGGDDAKPARDTVYAIFDAICAAVVADPTLGGLLKEWADVGQHTLEQTHAADDEASRGRRAVLTWSLSCRTRITYP